MRDCNKRTMVNCAATAVLIYASLVNIVVAQSITRAREPELVSSYQAWIGRDDLYNSSGSRLTKPWQIIRQDRANFHSYGIRDDGDEDDAFFVDQANRQALETMLARGSMSSSARRMLLRGNCWINVSIYGLNESGSFIEVEVWE